MVLNIIYQGTQRLSQNALELDKLLFQVLLKMLPSLELEIMPSLEI